MQIRRLYDIANVFLALGIIKKAHLDNKKPAFVWRGIEGLNLTNGKGSEKSTACEESFTDNQISPISLGYLDTSIIVPQVTQKVFKLTDTPLPKVQDDFKFSSQSAFKICRLFVSNEKICQTSKTAFNHSTPVGNKLFGMSGLVCFA